MIAAYCSSQHVKAFESSALRLWILEEHIMGNATPCTRRRLEHRYAANLSASPIQQSGTPSRGSSRFFVASPGASSIFAGAGLNDHIRSPYGGDQLDATGDGRCLPPRTTTRMVMTGQCSRLRTWVVGVSLRADRHSDCLGRLFVFAEQCMISIYMSV
jgi:hypothetical protein